METNETNVLNESLHTFRNCNENESIENNLIIRSQHFFADFPSLDLNNSSVVYESIDLIESEDNNHKNEESFNKSNDSQFCDNNCQQIINKLIADNEEMKKFKRQLIVIEEQNVELIGEKQRLESELNQMKDKFEKKVILKNESIEDLKKSLYIYESLNSSLQKELELKRCEKQRLENRIHEIEDKLYFCEMQLIESQKSEEELLTSFKTVKQAFTEEEDNKYQTIEQLHTVYVECAQQHNQIQELKQQVSDLSRDIADKDNELWFYKLKFDESFSNPNKTDRHSIGSQRESIYVNKTASEIPEYSFSVDEDDSEHIYSDFIGDISPIKEGSDESNEFHSISEETEEVVETVTQTVVETEKPFYINLFYRLIDFLVFLITKFPFKLILTLFLMVLSSKLLLGTILATRLPAYTSWEEILYRVIAPYLSKVKVSRTQ